MIFICLPDLSIESFIVDDDLVGKIAEEYPQYIYFYGDITTENY